MNGVLHIFNQYQQHDEAYIIGNKEALTALRDAINQALENEKGLGATDFDECVKTVDGEGYQVLVVRNDDDWQAESWQNLQFPYKIASNPDYFPEESSKLRPYELWEKNSK